MATMKAIVMEQYGEVEHLHEKQVDIPKINKDQVLIQMKATSINPIDWKIRKGYLKENPKLTLPIILGFDAAGVIIKIGENVTNYKIGDKVFTKIEITKNGAYAEYVATEANIIAKIPERLSFEEAASLPLAGLTAWQALLNWGEIKEKNKLLIYGGSGGVGTLAIQIAKIFNVNVSATTSSSNEQLVKSLGADNVTCYDQNDYSKELKEFDVVLDCVGGEVVDKSFNVLKKGGKFVSIVQQPDIEKAKKFNITPIWKMVKSNGEQLKQIAEYVEQGSIKTVIHKVFNFNENELREAHKLSESHHAVGKIVIKIDNQ